MRPVASTHNRSFAFTHRGPNAEADAYPDRVPDFSPIGAVNHPEQCTNIWSNADPDGATFYGALACTHRRANADSNAYTERLSDFKANTKSQPGPNRYPHPSM